MIQTNSTRYVRDPAGDMNWEDKRDGAPPLPNRWATFGKWRGVRDGMEWTLGIHADS
jgi:hypothetical protein